MSEKSHDVETTKNETEETVTDVEVASEEAPAIEPEIEPAPAEDGGEGDELAQLQAENADLKARILRAHADLENFKKRAERDKQDTVRFANKTVFGNLLGVIDNFDLAMMAATDPKDPFVVGVDMISKQLIEVLRQGGVEVIEAEGRAFDPYLHEAIAQEETADVEENTVIQVMKKGYRFHGQLLRPAAVKVAKAPQAAEPEAATEPESDEEN
jgi:molecular chaperone GrpE